MRVLTALAALTIAFLAGAVPAAAEPMTLLSAGNGLHTFDTNSPEFIGSPRPVTGIGAGEELVSIDYRPSNGVLYGLSLTAAGSALLYAIDDGPSPRAVAVGPAFSLGAPGSGHSLYGADIDFDPVADQLRVVTGWGAHQRVDPATAAVVAEAPLSYAAGDPNEGEPPAVLGIAYANNFFGAPSTTVFGYEAFWDDVVRLGSPGGTPVAPASGVLTTISDPSSGEVAYGQRHGFDISQTGNAYLTLDIDGDGTPGEVGLYTVDLAAGTVELIGLVGGGQSSSLDISAPATAQELRLSQATAAGTEGTTVTLALNRTQTVGAAEATLSGGGADTEPASQVVRFEPGQQSTTASVRLSRDRADEGTETVTLALSNPRGGRASVGGTPTVITIANRPSPPQIRLCGPKRQNVGERGFVQACLRLDEPGRVIASGTLRFKGGASAAARVKLKRVRRKVNRSGKAVRLKLKVPRRRRGAVRGALDDGRRVTATIKLVAIDRSGFRSRKSRKVRAKPL